MYVGPEGESQEVENTEPGFGTDDVGAEIEGARPLVKPMSKADAVRAAIAEGAESPQEASADIKRESGIDMAPQHYSTVESQLRTKVRDEAPEPAERGRKPAAALEVPAPASRRTNGEAGRLWAREPLVASMGAERMRKLVDLVG